MKISEVSGRSDLGWKIIFESKAVDMWFHPITESDVLSRYANDVWGERRLHITKPTMRGKPVMAWGGVECSDRTGLNVVLVSSESDDYGDWYLLKNTHSGLARHRDNRPDPFAFTNDELIKEIHNIGVTHVYNLNIKPLDISELIEFISSGL